MFVNINEIMVSIVGFIDKGKKIDKKIWMDDWL